MRNIDDLSEFAVNQCYGPGEKLDLGGVDEVVSLAAAWMRTFGVSSDRVQVELSTGLVLEGEKGEEFKGKELQLSGRCLDLKAAYKQLALSPADRNCAVIAVSDPQSDEVRYFVFLCAPLWSDGVRDGFQPGSKGAARGVATVPADPSDQLLRRFPACGSRGDGREVSGGHGGGYARLGVGHCRGGQEADPTGQEVCGPGSGG